MWNLNKSINWFADLAAFEWCEVVGLIYVEVSHIIIIQTYWNQNQRKNSTFHGGQWHSTSSFYITCLNLIAMYYVKEWLLAFILKRRMSTFQPKSVCPNKEKHFNPIQINKTTGFFVDTPYSKSISAEFRHISSLFPCILQTLKLIWSNRHWKH